MRVLVTGHNGYIGAAMIPLLLSEGFDVVGLDNKIFEECVFGAPPIAIPEIKKDIRDATVGDMQGFDAVFHLAALSNDPLSNLDPELTYAINHKATVHLARVAKAAGVPRFLFSSSCSAYGASSTDDMLTEEASFNPVTPYGESKVLAEQELMPLADAAFSPVYLRNATAYGVSPMLRFDLVLNNLVAWAMATGKIYMKSDGTPWRPIVHIEDIARAFVALARAPRDVVHNQAFNVGRNDQNYRISELAEIVREVVPGSLVEYAEGAQPDKRCYRVDFSKIATLVPAFQLQWDARTGARQLHSAYQQVGVQLEDFEGPRYKRIDHLKRLLAEGRLDASLRWNVAELAEV